MKSQYERNLHYLLAVLGIFLGTVLDQATKYFRLTRLKGQKPNVIIKVVFHMEYLENL